MTRSMIQLADALLTALGTVAVDESMTLTFAVPGSDAPRANVRLTSDEVRVLVNGVDDLKTAELSETAEGPFLLLEPELLRILHRSGQPMFEENLVLHLLTLTQFADKPARVRKELPGALRVLSQANAIVQVGGAWTLATRRPAANKRRMATR